MNCSYCIIIVSVCFSRGGGAQKRKTAVFNLKSHFARKKSAATNFFCLKTVSNNCTAFAGLTIRAKVIEVLPSPMLTLLLLLLLVGDVPLNVNFALGKLLLGATALLSRIVTNALFASQLLQKNQCKKFLSL